jgi:hypothetical protein
MFYAIKLLILGQDVLVRICSKVNDDKMVMNLFENDHIEDAKEVD